MNLSKKMVEISSRYLRFLSTQLTSTPISKKAILTSTLCFFSLASAASEDAHVSEIQNTGAASLSHPDSSIDRPFKVTSSNIDCTATNGLRIVTKDMKHGLVTTKLGLFYKDFSATLFPAFGGLTWISLRQADEPIAKGYQIFLTGNAPAGQSSVLSGSIGQILSVPAGASGLSYPTGFIPLAAITCKLFWVENFD